MNSPKATFYRLTESIHYQEENPGPPHEKRARVLPAGIVTEDLVISILGTDALLRLRDAGILVDPKKPEPTPPPGS